VRVLILGAGGHGQVIADILMTASRHGADVSPCGYLDDDATLWGTVLCTVPVIGALSDRHRFDHDAVIVGIGDNATRRRLFEVLSRACERFATARHPSAIVSSGSVMRQGTAVCAGVIVGTGACIGSNVILNTGCSIDHHCVVGDHAHIAPGARLGGEVTIGQGALIGIGAVVLPGRHVGAWTVVGAGAVVTRDLPDGVVAVGSPARALMLKTATHTINH
jgi:sugar O-acyltransferase (sialic acid O-acetyltransferase NeuD family)